MNFLTKKIRPFLLCSEGSELIENNPVKGTNCTSRCPHSIGKDKECRKGEKRGCQTWRIACVARVGLVGPAGHPHPLGHQHPDPSPLVLSPPTPNRDQPTDTVKPSLATAGPKCCRIEFQGDKKQLQNALHAKLSWFFLARPFGHTHRQTDGQTDRQRCITMYYCIFNPLCMCTREREREKSPPLPPTKKSFCTPIKASLFSWCARAHAESSEIGGKFHFSFV